MSVISRDAIESDIKRLLDDLLQSAATSHARTVLRDAVWSIEDRAFSRTDPNARDLYVEQRVRDVLGELSKPNSSSQSLEIALEFIDALLGIEYTDRNNKFTRLCRSLFVVLQCGNEYIVKCAQRVFTKMVELDSNIHSKDANGQAPLKEFLPKELKDMCETVAREADGRSTPSRNKSLAVMVASEALVKVYPRYVNTQLRGLILSLSITLCGTPDVAVRSAAYDCLLATLSNTTGLKSQELQAESRKLAEECSRSLRASHNTEHQTTSTLLSLRALLSSRGVSAIEKQLLTTFCTAVLEQHKITRSPQVKSAVCSLIPLIARADPVFSARKQAYCALMMDPLKNLRDETNKVVELHNMAEFLRNAGYDTLDNTMKVNLESVVLRYVSRPSTQLECWNILSAIAKHYAVLPLQTPTRTAPLGMTTATALSPPPQGAAGAAVNQFVEIVRRCLPQLNRSYVTSQLLEHLESIQNSIPLLAKEIHTAQQFMIDVVLRRAAQNEQSAGFGMGSPSASSGGFFGVQAQNSGNSQGSGADRSPQSQTPVGAVSTPASAGGGGGSGGGGGFGFGRLVSYFNRNSNQNTANEDQQIVNVSAEEIEVALIALAKRPVEDYTNLVEELRINILALQRHPSSRVRKQCSSTILSCIDKASIAAGSQHTKKMSAESASNYFFKLEELLEAYLKNAVMELEPQCRMAMVEAFCHTHSVMQLVNRPKVLNTVMSFLNDTSRIREVVVRALVEECQQLKKDDVDVTEVERQLKITVETSILALEYSLDTRLLLRHLADLAIFTRFGIDPVLPLMSRTFVALSRKLKEEGQLDIVILNILKTLKYLITPLVSNDLIASKFVEEISDLHKTILSIFLTSTTVVITLEAIKVLVLLNNLLPVVNLPQVEVMKVVDYLGTVFMNNKQIQREDLLAILTLFGQMGAVKPFKVVEAQHDEEKLASDADLTLTFDYAVIVYRALSRMLETSLAEAISFQVMKLLLQVVHGTSADEIGGVHAIKAVLNLCKRAETSTLRVESLKHLAELIKHRHQNTIAYLLTEIVVLLDQLWLQSEPPQFYAILEVVEALQPGNLPIKDQQDIWPWLYPRLIDAAMRDNSAGREIALKIVNILSDAKLIPPHCVPFLTVTLTSFIQQSDQPSELRGAAIVAVVEVVCSLDLIQHVSPLLHALRTLARHLELSADLSSKFSVIVKDSLKKLLRKFPTSRPIVIGINELLEHHADDAPTPPQEPEPVIEQDDPHLGVSPSTLSSRKVLDGASMFPSSVAQTHDSMLAMTLSEPNPADVASLHKHVERGLRITEQNKWKDWFLELQRLVVLSSPHYAFRLVVELFEKHEPLRRELFFPSFKCLYESLSTDQVGRLNQALEQAVHSNDGEVTAKCLSLADYLDHNRPLWESTGSPTNQQASSKHRSETPPFLPPAPSHRYTPEKTLTRNYDFASNAFDDPDFFNSPTSIRKPVIPPSRSIAKPVMLEGSLVFPQTPPRMKVGTAGGKNRGGQSMKLGGTATHNKNQSQRFAAMSDMFALGEKQDSTIMSSTQLTPPSINPFKPVLILPGENPLFSQKVMIDASQVNGMFDKAIRFLELKLAQFLGPIAVTCGRSWPKLSREVMDTVVLPLAQLYSRIGMQASVVGLFESIQYLEGHEANGIAFELLYRWNDARSAYSSSLRLPVNRPLSITEPEREGFVRTLCLCGDWRSALLAAKEMVKEIPNNSSIPVSGATAAWILGEWDDVSRFAQRMTMQEPLQYFFVNGVVFQRDTTNGNDQLACIRDARLSLEASLKTLLPLSYAHAYDNITMLQHFQEIWEAASYHRAKSSERKRQIRELWTARFTAMNTEKWFPKLRSLMVHSLVLSPSQIPETWLQFCESVRSTYPQLANWAMRSLLTDRMVGNATEDIRPEIVEKNHQALIRVGYFTHLWNTGKLSEAVAGMQQLLRSSPQLQEEDPRSFGTGHLKLGVWKQELHADTFWKSNMRDEIVVHLYTSVRSRPDDYDTWHAWALMNYRIQQRESTLDTRSQSVFISKAHQGFVAAICLSTSTSNALQDIMRLLQLWIVYGGVTTLKESIADAVHRISVEHWIQVVPQLIAHLGHEHHDVRDVVFRILQKISSVHPQVVVFPLLVNTMHDPHSLPPERTNVRETLSRALLETFVPQRVRKDAETAGRQLCYAASLPVEHILEHLTQVADAWSSREPSSNPTEDDDAHLLRRLTTCIYIYQKNPNLRQLGDIGKFVQIAIDEYRRGDRNEASSIVDQLVEEIGEYVKKLRKVGDEAQRAMEPLASVRNLSVCMFGEYNWMNPSQSPTIASFSTQCDVIRSKKRPRKIRVTGSNGFVYAFLLKSNEDIRLDERVMQLFGLVNSFMDPQIHSPNCLIHKFPVIPISANVGLLGWVEYSDTMHDVIAKYREASGVDGMLERNLLAGQFDEPYDDLMRRSWERISIIRRAEAVEHVFSSSQCESADLARSMWQRSPSAEVWLERRTAFTESLATMSMVGYILGLGDRHLGNIMLSMSSGRIVHIDFGDSFDVCRIRSTLPETVPFRLTRMLIHAMEVFGEEGVFRSTCVSVLSMLHQNRDSIIALLSAFIYDPIVSHQESMRSMMERQKSPQDIVERIRHKLRGLELAVPDDQFAVFDEYADFSSRPDVRFISNAFNDLAKRDVSTALRPKEQVQMLIAEATNIENLAAMYYGWAPLW